MERLVSITAAGEFCDALENWIIDNKYNPTTSEEWERCIQDMIADGAVKPVGCIKEEDAEKLKEQLKNTSNLKEL